MDKKNIFRSNLVKRRKELGLTQDQLAQWMNVSPQAVSKWENSSYPDTELLPRLAKALNISLDALFGISEADTSIDIEQAVHDAVHSTLPENRPGLLMRLIYVMMCAYNPTMNDAGNLHDVFERETFSGFKTNHDIALARLNPDLRYFMYIEKPKNGIGHYVTDTKYMARLFKTLADEDAIRIVSYLCGCLRNTMHSVSVISEKLSIPEEKVQNIIDRLDRFGLVWRMAADIGEQVILYGYTHSQPITMMLVLAQSLCNYLQFWDMSYDEFSIGMFTDENACQAKKIPQVSWWNEEET